MPSPSSPPNPYLRFVGILKDADGRIFRTSITTSPDADENEVGNALYTLVSCLGYDPDEVAEAIHKASESDIEDLPDYLK